MNESFQVIITHQQYLRFKQIQKENEMNLSIVRELKHQLQNMRLKYEQIENKYSDYEVKIKELSKNSIRLSRRLLIQQEEHHKTQQYALNREKQLIQKMLSIANQHQNSLASMQKLHENNKNIKQYASNIKNKICQKDAFIINLTTSLTESKKQFENLSQKYVLLQRQFIEQVKQSNELKVRLQDIFRSKQKIRKQILILREQHNQQLERNKLKVQTFNKQLQEREVMFHQAKLDYQVENGKLKVQIQGMSEQIGKLSEQKEKVQVKNIGLNQNMKKLLELSKEKIKEHIKTIELQLKEYSLTLEKLGKQIELIKNKQNDQNSKLNKQKASFCQQIQMRIRSELKRIRQQLIKDGINQENTIIQLQLRNLMTQIKSKFKLNWMIL